MTVRWTVRAAEDRARSSRENRVLPPQRDGECHLVFFCAWVGGLEGRAEQSKLPVDVCDRERPSRAVRGASRVLPARRDGLGHLVFFVYPSRSRGYHQGRRAALVSHEPFGAVSPLRLDVRSEATE